MTPVERLLADVRKAVASAGAEPPSSPPPPSGASVDGDLVRAFVAALEEADGRTILAADDADARRRLEEILAGRATVDARQDPAEAALRAAEVGVDRADLLIAETGTIVRTFASVTEARVSLVPPTSVFLARAQDIVRDLPTALERLATRHQSGAAQTVFITGPSRTADIEKRLVIPAHGPREVVVLLTHAS